MKGKGKIKKVTISRIIHKLPIRRIKIGKIILEWKKMFLIELLEN